MSTALSGSAILPRALCALSVQEILFSLSAPATIHHSGWTGLFVCSYFYYITLVILRLLVLCGVALENLWIGAITMSTNEKKGVTVKIDAELHAEAKQVH